MGQKNSIFDIAIIGAGCVGSAIAQRLAKYQVSIALLEKEADVAMGASKANSGIIHSGYFTAQGSLKEKLNLRGNPMFDEVCPQIGVEYKKIGAIFCATNDSELQTLKNELEICKERKIPVELIEDKKRIHEMEPQLNENVIAILHFPTAGIIMPFEFTVALAEHAVINGTDLMLNFEVAMIEQHGNQFSIYAKDGRKIEAKTIINAAGVYSDKIASMVGLHDFNITPRRGEYILFDKNSLHLEKIVFPTPTINSKGIVVGPTIHGNFYIGPNAVEIDDREGTNTTVEGLNEILTGANKLIKHLPLRKNITNFAGVRATANEHDFIVGATKVPQFVNAAGIDSPGLSSSLAIAEMIEDVLKKDCGYDFIEKPNYIPTRKAPVRLTDLTAEELAEKIKTNPQWGRIICRCETISEAEIVEACHSVIPCTNTDMVKRRLRPGMGRCQGGFCLPKVMKIISREQKMILETVTKSGKSSKIVYGRTKNIPPEIIGGSRI